jgi:hypothetical protein
MAITVLESAEKKNRSEFLSEMTCSKNGSMKTFRNLLGGGNVPENHISSRQKSTEAQQKGKVTY